MYNYFNNLSETALSEYEIGTKIELIGICKSNVFKSDDSDYAVFNFELADKEKDNKFKIQGSFPNSLIEGQTYRLNGKIIEYRGEKQLRVANYHVSKPINKKGIIAYLQTLHGLKSKAELIYNEFGDECIDILLKEPMKVSENIKGIGKKSVKKWQEQLEELEDNKETLIKLLGYGISNNNCNKLIKEFGDKVLGIIESNPYMLIKQVKGYGFLKCDNIALTAGLYPDDINRIKSSVTYVLEESATSGNCFLPSDELINNINRLLSLKLSYMEMIDLYNNNMESEKVNIIKYDREYEIDIPKLKDAINDYESQKNILDKKDCRYVYHKIDDSEIANQINDLIYSKEIINDKNNIYLKRLYFSEIGFSNNIKRLSNYTKDYTKKEIEKVLNEICKEKGYVLEEKQRKACVDFNISNQGVFILNGSAGTGKTFTLNLILEVQKRLSKIKEEDILVVAPTGKASKVASKSTGMECLTIHRALGFNPMAGFEKNEYNQFEQSIIVCDEGSMLDIELAYSFIKAISNGSKFIIMGDIKQLASVGAGNVLKDLIEHSEDSSIKKHYTKVITLDVIKRQGLLSGIVKNANRIINDEMMCTEDTTKDFFVQKKDTFKDVRNCVVNSIRRLLTYPNYTLEEIQVLIPQRTGTLGVYVFNYILQKIFNPYKEGNRIFKSCFEAKIYDKVETHELYIQKGDKVMHIKNNYELKLYTKNSLGQYELIPDVTGITNGETGIVEEVVKGKGGFNVIVKYEDFYAFYEDGVDELELSYAITIHKSQGSAWRAIILPVVSQHIMLSNNLVYTGITRAREFCTVIGDSKAMYLAIKTHRDYNRYTGLKDKLAS